MCVNGPYHCCTAGITHPGVAHLQQLGSRMPTNTDIIAQLLYARGMHMLCKWHQHQQLTLHCVVDPKTWQPAVGTSEASPLVARLLGFLASKCSLFPGLAQLLLVATQPQPQQQEQQQSAMSILEALASNLAVRFLSLKRFPEVAAAQASLAKLLCVPLLWQRCPHVLFSVSLLPWQRQPYPHHLTRVRCILLEDHVCKLDVAIIACSVSFELVQPACRWCPPPQLAVTPCNTSPCCCAFAG